MKPARLILVIVAIVAGGMAAFLATRGRAPAPEPATVTQIQQEAKTQILVAKVGIGVGERLNAAVLQWQDWPVGAIRPEYVTIEAVPGAMDELAGAVARFEFFPGEPIREAKLARSEQGYLSAVIEPGKRAVSIDVTASSGAGGFIVPNDHVDVVLTHDAGAGRISETILHNVKVLAIGQRLGETGKSGGSDSEDSADPQAKTFQQGTIATLELDPYQSETIVNASEIGSIALVLRSVVDFVPTAGTSDSGRQNATIKLIRFGQTSSVTSGSSGGSVSGTNTPPPSDPSPPTQTEPYVTPPVVLGPAVEPPPVRAVE